MNIFTTVPKFLQGYFETKRYNSLKGEIQKKRDEGDIEGEKELIHFGQRRWVENITKKYGITYDVRGEENIPPAEDGPFMIYSNHQGYADLAATMWIMRNHGMLAYVAKDDWRKYGVLRDAVVYTRSIFLVRDNPKEAVRALAEAKKVLGLGFNMIIFPEGTRSKGHEMGEFKPGAFKFAEKAKVPILPVTIDGSYKLFEETGSYQKCHIKVTIHPLVHIEQMNREEQHEAAKEIEATIRAALDE